LAFYKKDRTDILIFQLCLDNPGRLNFLLCRSADKIEGKECPRGAL